MFCPNCGQERLSDATNFCSRCGFSLSGTAQLLVTGGIIEQASGPSTKSISSRKRGLKQGLFIFLLTFLVVPLVGLVAQALQMPKVLVGIATMIFFMGGLLRMVYAVMFESPEADVPVPPESTSARSHALRSDLTDRRSLPEQQAYLVQSYVSPQSGNWRDTNDLQPVSVTDPTTQLLEKPHPDQ